MWSIGWWYPVSGTSPTVMTAGAAGAGSNASVHHHSVGSGSVSAQLFPAPQGQITVSGAVVTAALPAQ